MFIVDLFSFAEQKVGKMDNDKEMTSSLIWSQKGSKQGTHTPLLNSQNPVKF